MWFGSQNGLTRYDGRRTIVYRTVPGNPRSLADNRVQVLHVDARDRLWVGTRRGLQRFDPAHGDFTHLVPHGTGRSANPTVQAIVAAWRGRRLGASLHAGPERSVAATKSYIASLVAGARLVAEWGRDRELQQTVAALPAALRAACRCDWSSALDVLAPARNLMVVGRGTGFPVALEAALKFKETSALQAEAFSGAEIKRGPMASSSPATRS